MTYANQTTKFVNFPLTLQQIAMGLRQLPKEDLETLDVMLDEEFSNTLEERKNTAWNEYQQGGTLTLESLKKELDV